MSQSRTNNPFIKIGIAILTVSILSIAYSRTIGLFAVNTETCIKGRYFYINRLNKTPKDGEYVAFLFKGSSIYPKGAKFIKIVGCTAGEKLTSKQTQKGYAFFCNNRLLGYACNKKENPKCPAHTTYNEIIPKGYFYALGTAWNAYDSRYWGLASTKSIIGIGYKIF